jgi:hypothetical protein
MPEDFKPQWLEFWFSCGSDGFGVLIFFFKQIGDDSAALLQGDGHLKVEHQFLFSIISGLNGGFIMDLRSTHKVQTLR